MVSFQSLDGNSEVEVGNKPISSKRQLELEQQVLEAKLRQQKIQSDLDNKWRQQEETTLRNRLSASGSFDSADSASSETHVFAGNNPALNNMTANIFDKDRSSTPNSSGSSSSRATGSDDKPIIVKDLKPTPTAKLERSNDRVYEATTSVVRAVMVLSQGVQSKSSSSTGQKEEHGNSGRRGSNPSNNTNHLENVKSVGIELRALLAAVDNIVPAFPTSTHREVSIDLKK